MFSSSCVVVADVSELPCGVKPPRSHRLPALFRDADGVLWGVTGVGRRRVRQFYRQLDASGMVIKRILVVGFSGSLDPHLRRDTLVTYDRVMDTAGKTCILSPLSGLPSVCGMEVEHWTDREEKLRWKRLFPEVKAIDMECVSHYEACASRGWEVSFLRVISDNFREKLPPVSYVVGQWWQIPLRRMFFHPIHWMRGVCFSLRLQWYRERLASWMRTQGKDVWFF